MINNIFELSNTSVEEIATHRTDIVAVPLEATLAEIKEVLMEEKYSRIVVYEDSIDNIVGVFHVKDLVKYILTDSTRMEEGNFHLEDIMMQPYFVPFSKKTDELIEEMLREKVHMAIVIDEYGGTSGIVTMEDVMEEIVGNIFDEYDLEEEEDICPIDENSYSISGKADLQDVAEQLGIVFEDDEDYDTFRKMMKCRKSLWAAGCSKSNSLKKNALKKFMLCGSRKPWKRQKMSQRMKDKNIKEEKDYVK